MNNHVALFRYRDLAALYLDRAFRAFDPQRRYRLVEFAPAHALYKMMNRYPFIAYRSADLLSNTADDRVDLTNCPYADGSVDIYVGPKSPTGKESNWIYTPPGKNWYPWFRFYGPEKAVFDKSWKMPGIEKVKG